MKSLLGVLLGLLLAGSAQAQVAPAQMGITPTTVPEVLQVLDANKVWVPIGTVDPSTHLFNGGGGGIGSGTVTNMLSGRPNSAWTASFHAGRTCAQSNNALFPPPPAVQPPAVFCGGTEGREFAVKNPGTPIAQLFMGNGYWMDQPGPEGAQNAQILVLNGPERPPYSNAWLQDVNLGQAGFAPAVGAVKIGTSPVTSSQYCPTDNPVCALSVGALQSLNFLWDIHGNPVNLSVTATLPTSASFNTSSPNITMAVANPGSVVPGMYVNDLTLVSDQGIGTVLTYSGTALVLTANAARIGGAGDQLQFGLPSGTNILVASSWWEGTSTLLCPGQTPVFAWARNNTLSDLQWYQTLIECDPGAGAGSPQIRAFGTHIDLLATQGAPPEPLDLAFAGASPAGIYNGQLNNNRGFGNNTIVWNPTGLEWRGSDYPIGTPGVPQCTNQIRVMGFAEAKGSDGVNRIYMSACFGIYVRVDGPQGVCLSYQVSTPSCVPRWKLYWQWSDPLTGPGHPVEEPVSQSGLRGLTYVPGENVFLIGAEGASPMAFFTIKPFPACATPTDTTCFTIEYPVFSQTSNSLDPNGTFTVGNTVAPYNDFPQVFDETGVQHFVAPMSSYIAAGTKTLIPPWTFMFIGDSGGGNGKKLGEAIYTFRSSAGKYNLAYIPQLFSTPMNGTRDMALSPFSQDCGYYGSNALSCAVYATGFDADGSTLYYWCRTNPCPNPPAVPPYVPMHNMMWIARGGYPGP